MAGSVVTPLSRHVTAAAPASPGWLAGWLPACLSLSMLRHHHHWHQQLADPRAHCRPGLARAVRLRVAAMADSSKVVLHYFPLRGRVEVVKLLCAAKDIPWEVVPLDFALMKTDRVNYPFGQCPRMVDGEVDITQSNAMIRHLARKHGLYGAGEVEMAAVDVLMDGVEGVRGKYLQLIYQDQLSAEAKAAYWATHGARDSANGRNGGAHFEYFDGLLARNGGGAGFFVGSGLTAADLCVWEIVDIHLRIFTDELTATYPLLVAHHARIAELPGIKEYLASPRREEKVNGNGLG